MMELNELDRDQNLARRAERICSPALTAASSPGDVVEGDVLELTCRRTSKEKLPHPPATPFGGMLLVRWEWTIPQ